MIRQFKMVRNFSSIMLLGFTFSFIALVLTPAMLEAAAGDLDATFGSGGKVLTEFGGTEAIAYAMAIQPDGKIVVAGYTGFPVNFALCRFNTDGTLDNTFGSGGKVITNVLAYSIIRDVVLQPDGKIVVAGEAVTGGNFTFALGRYNSDGSLDVSFGVEGIVTTDFGLGGGFGRGVVLQPDGKIVVAGYAVTTSQDFTLARYNTDGSLDITFGSGGKLTTDFSGEDQAYAIALQPDGKIIAAGVSNVADADFGLARYNPDGSLDTSFGVNGKVISDFGSYYLFAVSLQPDGKIVAAGGSGTGWLLARYNPDGSLDTNFGSDGQVAPPIYGRAYDISLQSDGKIVVAGDNLIDFVLARFETDGSLDSLFGVNGIVITSFGPLYDSCYAVQIQSDGKIVCAGRALIDPNYEIGVARYEGDSTSPPPTCNFFDDFDDGVLPTDWAFPKPQWSETGGDLIGTPVGRKAETLAMPAYGGCSQCNVRATMRTSGGVGNRVWLLSWYVDKKNTIEVLMKQENGKWVVKQKANGSVVAKGKGVATILPDTEYDVQIAFDGTNFTLTVNGVLLATVQAGAGPFGTVGFRVKNTTAYFGLICVN